ncbi:MAG: hypothetical protein ACON4G_08145 [Candidatus Puniceispirillaceae bacterium]
MAPKQSAQSQSLQDLELDNAFGVVEALYEEAERLRPPKRLLQSRSPAFETPQDIARAHAKEEVPLFTRITDLYEEAEATKFLAIEAETTANQPEMPQDVINEEVIADELEAEDPITNLVEDEFAIPDRFGIPEEDTPPIEDLISEEEEIDQILANNAPDEHELPVPTLQDDGGDIQPSNAPSFADDITASVSLDDALEALNAPEHTAEDTQDNQSQATTLAEMDEARPAADDELAKQLSDVKEAVAQAQMDQGQNDQPEIADNESEIKEENAPQLEAAQDDAPDDQAEEPKDDLAKTQLAGPALVAFIGETVRDVLDDTLPDMVRDMVDEALGERQGRYGRPDTPNIGLRTKPSRH